MAESHGHPPEEVSNTLGPMACRSNADCGPPQLQLLSAKTKPKKIRNGILAAKNAKIVKGFIGACGQHGRSNVQRQSLLAEEILHATKNLHAYRRCRWLNFYFYRLQLVRCCSENNWNSLNGLNDLNGRFFCYFAGSTRRFCRYFRR